MLHLFGLATDDLRRRLGNELLATQRDDGSWANWWNGPADLSTTVESYYALRLCGIPADDPRLLRAKEVVHSLGGAERARFFTKLWLAVMGRYPWDRIPVLPPEMILLPARAPLSPVPLRLLGARDVRGADDRDVAQAGVPPAGRPGRALHRPAGVPPAAGVEDAGRVDAAPHLGDEDRRRLQPAPDPLAARNVRAAGEEVDHGAPGGRRVVGRHPAAVDLLDHRAPHARPAAGPPGAEGGDRRLRRTRSPSTPTAASACASRRACRPSGTRCLAAVALADAGAAGDDPALPAACDWMLAKEIARIGRLALRAAPGPAGRLVVRVRERVVPRHRRHRRSADRAAPRRPPRPSHPAVRRGVDWLLGHAERERRLGRVRRRQRPPDHDPAAALRLRRGHRPADRGRHGATWSRRSVECGVPRTTRRGAAGRRVPAGARSAPTASWWGRWGVNHVYGTGAALPALAAAGEDMRCPAVAPRGRVPGRAPERRRRLGRGLRELRRPGVDRPRRVHRLADRLGAAGAHAADPTPPGGGQGPRVPGAHPEPGRVVGRGGVHRHGLPPSTS